VGANISGFVLDLEPSIADHVASLVDVYKRGKERVDRFTVNALAILRSRTPSRTHEG
jgi:hypothetical protein